MIAKLITDKPEKRLTAKQAMEHPWLRPLSPESLPNKRLGRRSTSESIDQQLGNYENSMRERFSYVKNKLQAVAAFSKSGRSLVSSSTSVDTVE